MKSALKAMSDSTVMQVIIALVFYAFYAAVIGLSLFPAILFLAWTARELLAAPAWTDLLLFSMSLGGALFIYYIAGVFVMGGMIRLLSLGIKPGRYPAVSLTTIRWLLYSGVATIAVVTILPMIPVSWFSTLYFRIIGCKVGKNVYLNSFLLNDAYLIEIGDDVTVGGKANISCHLFEKNFLILDRIKIGSHSLIGAFSYISPGVEIGEHCTIGLNCYVRRGTKIKPGSVFTSLGGLPIKEMIQLEKHVARE